MKLAGKVLVVTGAGSGIGRAVALEAVRRRARVAAVDLNDHNPGHGRRRAALPWWAHGAVRAMVGLDAPRILTPDRRPRCSSARSP